MLKIIAETTSERRDNCSFSSSLDPFKCGFENYSWYLERYRKKNFSFPSLNSLASHGIPLIKKLEDAIKERNADIVESILSELRKYCIKGWDEMSEIEKWNFAAQSMPSDWGPPNEEDKEKLKNILSEEASGRVLEAMCGFRSYFNDTPNISEVIALDFSEEALKRYSPSERKRVLFDLEEIVKGKRLPFENEDFQTVGVFFAIDYISNPLPVVREFYRVLSKGGKLLIADGITQGYKDILKRPFNPERCLETIKNASFDAEIIYLKELKNPPETGYYLIKGIK